MHTPFHSTEREIFIKQTIKMEILNKEELVTLRVELLAKQNLVEFDDKTNSVLSSTNIRY